MTRPRKLRLPHIYRASFVRNGERRTFRVYGWNQNDAWLEACAALRAAGERVGGPREGWWYVGAERERY